jgi:hypothetical protein
MSQITFKTNLDAYQRVNWNYQMFYVPRKGEYVYLPVDYQSYCEAHHIPNRLEVTSVNYYMDRIEIELWFSKNDHEMYNSEEMQKKYGYLLYR